MDNTNKKLARLNEVKARAAVRTRRRLAEQNEEAEIRAEAARQTELAKVAREADKAEQERRRELNKQFVEESEKPLLDESKKAQNVNPEPAAGTATTAPDLQKGSSKKESK